jgi:hypothetical protein
MSLSTHRRNATRLITSAAAIAVFAPAVAAHADPPASVILNGHVVSAGMPVPGATVTLTAWPDADTLMGLPSGAPVGTTRLTTVIVGTDGSYAVAPDLSSLSARYREADGTVNVELEIGSPAGHAQYSLPVALSAHVPAAGDATTAVGGSRPARVDIDLAQHTVVNSLAAHTSGLATFATPVARSGDYKCGDWEAGDKLRQRPEKFMNVYADRTGKATVTETAASSHTLGVAIKISSGPWSVDGSASETVSDGSYATNTYAHDVAIKNTVDYRKYHRLCVTENFKTHWEHEARPGHFFALEVERLTEPIRGAGFSNCVMVHRGTYTKTHGRSKDFSLGMDLYFVRVEAHAAYSSHTRISWHITGRNRLCGSNDGWVHADQAEARKPSPRRCIPGKPCHTVVATIAHVAAR